MQHLKIHSVTYFFSTNQTNSFRPYWAFCTTFIRAKKQPPLDWLDICVVRFIASSVGPCWSGMEVSTLPFAPRDDSRFRFYLILFQLRSLETHSYRHAIVELDLAHTNTEYIILLWGIWLFFCINFAHTITNEQQKRAIFQVG